jgi:transposase-like protein
MMEGLRTPTERVMRVIILLAYGCPPQAIVHAYGVDERTVAQWQKRAGTHCQQVHQDLVEQGQVDVQHVQADEIRVKGYKMIAWMGLAIDVSTRLWLAGVVSVQRDTTLADQLLQRVRACCDTPQGLKPCSF